MGIVLTVCGCYDIYRSSHRIGKYLTVYFYYKYTKRKRKKKIVLKTGLEYDSRIDHLHLVWQLHQAFFFVARHTK